MKNLAAGANPIVLRKGMKKATDEAVDSIVSMSEKVSGKEQIAKLQQFLQVMKALVTW